MDGSGSNPSMNHLDISLPDLEPLLEGRLELLRTLAASMQISSGALLRNDAEAIARGAAHQAELCRQWSCLETELRRKAAEAESVGGSHSRSEPAEHGEMAGQSENVEQALRSSKLHAEWEALGKRIRYLARVHYSLLRHLERSLAVLHRVVESCAPTYTPDMRLLRRETLPNDLGNGARAGSGE